MSWDGEGGGQDDDHAQEYWLFGCSDGDYIQGNNIRRGLRTAELLSFLSAKGRQYPDKIHVAFGFNYDVTMLSVDLPDDKLTELKEVGRTSWGRWHLEWMPNKWFRVYDWKNHHGIRIYDGMTFFQTSFMNACKMVLGGSDARYQQVESGKGSRATFTYDQMDDIRRYMFTELSLCDDLFTRLRENLLTAGIKLRGWYGPGAIASALLTREGVKRHITRDLPGEVRDAAQHAYFGGRFESYYTGRYEGPVYSYDIRSAYPHALRNLPSLTGGSFLPASSCRPNDLADFALYQVRYTFQGPPSARLGFPHPFPYRDRQNRVFYPPAVEGWYWGVEVKAAMRVHGPKSVEILDGWVYVADPSVESVRPFAFVENLYERRAEWKREGNGAQLAAKLGLNSLYGKLAQRVGWDQEKLLPPRWHQLEYAGYVTATCRAMLYTAMMQNPGSIIAVETDGIYSRSPLELSVGQSLGQWEAETYNEIIYVQSGVYWTVGTDGTVNKAKVRGFGSGSFTYGDALRASEGLTPLIGATHRFGSLTGFIGKPGLRNWYDTDRVAQWGGGGKRGHATRLCHRCNGNDTQLHNLVCTNLTGGQSHPHFLPWKAAEGERNEYQENADAQRYAVVQM